MDGGNLGTFCKYANKKITCKTQLPTLLADGGVLVDVDDDKAALFNAYFGSTCVEDDGVTPQSSDAVPVGTGFDNIEFKVSGILAATEQMKSSCIADHEGFRRILIKQLADTLSHRFSLIYLSFMSVENLPVGWKRATVMYVFKSGSSSLVKNYRPI